MLTLDSLTEFGADVQDGELAHGEHLGGEAHREQRLLDEGRLAGTWRFDEHGVLSLRQEVGKDRAVALPADEVLAGHELVIRKRCVHIT